MQDCGNWQSKSEICRVGHREGQTGNSGAQDEIAIHRQNFFFREARILSLNYQCFTQISPSGKPWLLSKKLGSRWPRTCTINVWRQWGAKLHVNWGIKPPGMCYIVQSDSIYKPKFKDDFFKNIKTMPIKH